MSDHNHSSMVLAMAKKDLQALGGMLNEEIFDDEIFGFHAQQTVEKALKAWLSFLNISYPKIHDLDELLAILEDTGSDIPEQFRELTSLTDFAVQFRYESFEDFAEIFDRPEMLRQVTGLVAHVQHLVG